MALTEIPKELSSTPSIVDGGNATAITIDSSENVGIGTSATYNMRTTIAGAGAAVSTGTGSYALLSLYDTSTAGIGKGGGIAFQGEDGTNSAVTFAAINGSKENAGTGNYASYLGFSTRANGGNLTEKMRIDSSGHVGLGTNAPGSLLDLGVGSSGANQISWHNDATTSYGNIWQMRSNAATVIGHGLKGSETVASGFQASTSNTWGRSAIEQYYGSIKFYTNPASATTYGAAYTPSERMRIDSSGNLLVGTSVAHLTSSTFSGFTQFAGGHSIQKRSGGIVAYFDRLTNDGEIIQLRRDGTQVGSISATTNNVNINSSSTGILSTVGSARLYWDAAQLYPSVDNTYNLGYPSYRYDDVYSTGGINTSDRNEKQDIEELSDAEQRVAVACKGLMRKFRWKSAVIDKGDDARIHVGIMAQDLQAAFESEGLDPARYGMWCSDTWNDEETGEEITRMSVRYNELLAFIISAI